MPRTDEQARAARAPFSKPRVLPPPPVIVVPVEPEQQLARIEALLTHYVLRPLEQRKARAYAACHAQDTQALGKAVARLEFLIAERQQRTPAGIRALLNACYAPAYHALYPHP